MSNNQLSTNQTTIKNTVLNLSNYYWYLIILAITVVLCHGFLQMHFASDTYVLWDLGYMHYPQEYFLLDGRIFSALVCYIAGFFNLPLEFYIFTMTAIALIFLSLSIFIIQQLLIKILKKDDLMSILILTALSFLILLNQFTLELLLFPESAIMCLGLLSIVVALKLALDDKPKFFEIFTLLLIAGVCYQGLLNIFPTLILLFYILRQLTLTQNEVFNYKKALKNLVVLAGIVLLVLGITFLLVEFGKALFDSQVNRSNDLSTAESLNHIIALVSKYTHELWHQNLNMLPHYYNYVVITITFILLSLSKTKLKILVQYFFFILAILIMCIFPMFLFNTGPVGRVNIPMAMLWGSSLLILYTQITMHPHVKLKKIIEVIILLSFVFNCIFTLSNISEHRAANLIDENNGTTIRYKLERYEESTGITVTKVAVIYDLDPQQHATAVRPMSSLTERAFAVPWSVYEAINYYCGRDFERVAIAEILNYNYTNFTDDQLIFENDTLYFIIY